MCSVVQHRSPLLFYCYNCWFDIKLYVIIKILLLGFFFAFWCLLRHGVSFLSVQVFIYKLIGLARFSGITCNYLPAINNCFQSLFSARNFVCLMRWNIYDSYFFFLLPSCFSLICWTHHWQKYVCNVINPMQTYTLQYQQLDGWKWARSGHGGTTDSVVQGVKSSINHMEYCANFTLCHRESTAFFKNQARTTQLIIIKITLKITWFVWNKFYFIFFRCDDIADQIERCDGTEINRYRICQNTEPMW